MDEERFVRAVRFWVAGIILPSVAALAVGVAVAVWTSVFSQAMS